MELTAWPSVPIGNWQFAAFQVGIVLAVAGLVPVSLYVAGNRWPLGHVHRNLSLMLVGTDVIFLAIRPSAREAHIVILASATLFAAMLAVSISYTIEASKGWSQALKGRREWPQVAFDASLGVLLLCLALPLVKNLRPRGRQLCAHLSMVGVFERLNRLWFVWRTINLVIGLALFAVFTISCVSPSVADAILPRENPVNELIFLACTSALCFLSAWLPTAQRRFRLSLLLLRSRVRKQPEVDSRSVELSRADVHLSVAAADWPENPPGLAAALLIDEQPEALGRGGFGVVYAAQLEGKRVAVKQLVALDRNQAAVRRFRREADLLTTIDGHPHLCKCLGACLVRGLPAIVLDRYEGGSLDRALDLHHHAKGSAIGNDPFAAVMRPVGGHWAASDGSFTAKSANAVSEALRGFAARWQLIQQLARGLEHLHALQVHHRDIKPENVLLDRAHRRAVLSDFGLSRRTSALSEDSGPVEGSLRYMAPELMFERYEYASDVYSFALLMWTLAYGRLCFAEHNATQVMYLVQSNPATFRPSLSAPPALDLPGVAAVPPHIWEPMRGLIQECWHAEAVCRPTMGKVVGFLHDATPTAASAAMPAAA